MRYWDSLEPKVAVKRWMELQLMLMIFLHHSMELGSASFLEIDSGGLPHTIMLTRNP
jgi:hypothetical protein